MIIALDGPAGSGKSTLAKELAHELNINYLDTGAMYRAVTYYMLQNNIDIDSENEVKQMLDAIELTFVNNRIHLNGSDINDEIRNEEINQNISKVSADKEIREQLVKMQQAIGMQGAYVIDGRDIGTVVFPNAEYKFYIDASVEVRADRRVKQNEMLGVTESFEEIKNSIKYRDEQDKKREFGPLKKADDAVVIDTSNQTLQETIKIILNYIK